MKVTRVSLATLLVLFVAGTAAAAPTATPKRRARPLRAQPEDATQRIDINNISMVVKNTGSFAYDTEAPDQDPDPSGGTRAEGAQVVDQVVNVVERFHHHTLDPQVEGEAEHHQDQQREDGSRHDRLARACLDQQLLPDQRA